MQRETVKLDKVINEIFKKQKKTLEILSNQLPEDFSDKDILSYFTQINNDSLLSNTNIVNKAADLLQLLSESNNYNTVPLSVIEKIYLLIVEVDPFNILFYESLSLFLYNVLDKKIEARRILENGVRTVESKIAELKDFLKSTE